jgi:hypothetical protein
MSAPRHLLRLLPLVLIALIGVVVWLNADRHDSPPVSVACHDLVAGCVARVAGHEVRVRVDAPVKALRPFELWVEAASARRVEARFSMEGMDMGFNLYVLRDEAPGVFRARVTLPVCVSGSRNWLMTLELDGTRLVLPFVTEL